MSILSIRSSPGSELYFEFNLDAKLLLDTSGALSLVCLLSYRWIPSISSNGASRCTFCVFYTVYLSVRSMVCIPIVLVYIALRRIYPHIFVVYIYCFMLIHIKTFICLAVCLDIACDGERL